MEKKEEEIQLLKNKIIKEILESHIEEIKSVLEERKVKGFGILTFDLVDVDELREKFEKLNFEKTDGGFLKVSLKNIK